jgi:L-seryl-tRNA(Ser) seleniumtransferase
MKSTEEHNPADNDLIKSATNSLYRMLPSVNELLLSPAVAQCNSPLGHDSTVEIIRGLLEGIRREIDQGLHSSTTLAKIVDKLPSTIAEGIRRRAAFSLRRVINATGVLLHTNLGRAPLSQKALDHLFEIAAGYSNLEFDLELGERGKRDVHVESLLLALLALTDAGAETGTNQTHRAIVVNNCAAATFLALHALARGKQVLVSRGELVEIGGGFRIPEILQESGAVLREVGTTNRTRVSDYANAITSETGLILRVHQSNFNMEGFVERPNLEELIALGKRTGLRVFEDQGTGLVVSLETLGVRGETTLAASIAKGCDVVAASGDKLFGGPQCGILVGRNDLIDCIRHDPLFRALRADKLNYAALEATLFQYLHGDEGSIPVVRMLHATEDDLRLRCEAVAMALQNPRLSVEVVPVESVVGGGTAPKSQLASSGLAVKHPQRNATEVLRTLRRFDPPIIARIEDNRVLLDLRTVEPEADLVLITALSRLSIADAAVES